MSSRWKFSVSTKPMPWATPPSTCPRTCAGLITTRVEGLHAVQDADLTGDPVYRDPHALGVGADAARRAVALRASVSRIPRAAAAAFNSLTGIRLPPQITVSSARKRDARSTRCGRRRAATSGRAARWPPAAPRCRRRTTRRWRRRRCRNPFGRCRIGRGGSDRGGEQHGRGDLNVRGRGALAEFDRADRDLVPPVVAQGGPRLGDMLGGRRGLVDRAGGAPRRSASPARDRRRRSVRGVRAAPGPPGRCSGRGCPR